ncbi:MAG: leucyl aminopeptidase [bacterium]
MMKIRISGQSPGSYRGPVLVVATAENPRPDKGVLWDLDRASKGWIRRLLALGDFKGKPGEILVQRTMGALAPGRLMLVGLGKMEKLTLEDWRAGVSKAAQACRSLSVEEFGVSLQDPPNLQLGKEAMASAAVEGALLGLYRFKGYKKEASEDTDPRQMVLLAGGRPGGRMARVVEEAVSVCEAVYWVRDLVSQPSNHLTPRGLAEQAALMAKSEGVHCTVLEEDQLRSMNMGGILGVASGSKEPPRLIVLEYGKGFKASPTLALVGKGITFDSGGISLKPAEKMDQMKDDMAGGAVVLGVLKAVAKLKLPLHLVGVIPATENMPSGSAYKPGDVLTTFSGKSIEVSNTDAEGRVILADALSYALRYKPDLIIDLATLTGACIVALGDQIAGLMGTHQEAMEQLRKASEITGEDIWPLPLKEEYEELIKSDVADVKNSGGREAGAIQGALFLKKFVGETPWIHLDIAGPVWTDKDRPYRPKGATGFGVRLLVEFLKNYRR